MMLNREIKYRLATCIACISILIIACKKNEVSGDSGLFIKTIETDSATVAIRVLALQEESYLIISRDKIHEHPGYAFKTDKYGNLTFKKRLSSYNRQLQSVIDLPGNGFATVGHDDYFQQHIIVCFYDDDANFITSKQIQLPSNAGNYSNFRFLHLSNGNYVFASGNKTMGNGILLFTDNDFNNLSHSVFSPPTGYTGYAINALCELPGNTVAIAGSTSKEGATQLFTSITNMFILRTDFSGNQKSFTMMNDTVYCETPNCIFNDHANLFSVTARSIGFNSGNGLFVDYEYSYGSTISGMINLVVNDSIANLVSRKLITGYPLNGMIQNIKPTSDGGYILCGTVNQANNTTLVSETKIYLLKIDAERNVEWTRTINTTYPSYGTDVMQTADGGYFIIGQENSFNKKFQTIVIKTDGRGDVY